MCVQYSRTIEQSIAYSVYIFRESKIILIVLFLWHFSIPFQIATPHRPYPAKFSLLLAGPVDFEYLLLFHFVLVLLFLQLRYRHLKPKFSNHAI